MFLVVTANVYTDSAAVGSKIFAVLGPLGIVKSVLKFILNNRNKSLRWQRDACNAIMLLMRYAIANRFELDKTLLFTNFDEALKRGTLDIVSGRDKSQLGWRPRSDVHRRAILGYISDFLDYINQQPGDDGKWFGFEPDRFDWICDRAAFVKKRDAALLGHLFALKQPSGKKKYFGRSQIAKVVQSAPRMFPRSRFLDLLLKGFRVGNRIDYRGILITLLLYGGGFRASEPMHLFVEDVVPNPLNPKIADVRIHHPALGDAPLPALRKFGIHGEMGRLEYLNRFFGRQPRDRSTDKLHAGWKGGYLDGKYYKQAIWFPEEYGELFLKYWQFYMMQIASIPRAHPYAFINLSGKTKGEPYTITMYARAFNRAARRIGLTPGEFTGVHPHGLRHGYAGELKEAGVDPLIIQICLHHADIDSQKRYGQPSTNNIANELKKAESRLKSKMTNP